MVVRWRSCASGGPVSGFYKLFPALANEDATHVTVRAWRAVYPDVRIIYAGGVTLGNVGRLARKDPLGIFCGSALSDHADDPERLRHEAERWLEAIAGRGGAGEAKTARPAAAEVARRADGSEDARIDAASGHGVVTFGEIMLRLSPPPGKRFRQATGFDATYGGAEANVAVSLAQFGLPTRYVTALPNNDLGQTAVDSLRSLGVDTSSIVRRGDRIGIYFLEHGASQRPSRVIYDRAGSAVAGPTAGQDRLGERFRRSGLVPLDGDHAGPQRVGSGRNAGGRTRREATRAHRQRGSELPLEALVTGSRP